MNDNTKDIDKDIQEVLEKAEDLGGRPTVMTNKTVALLLNAFSNSFTDDEACIYANISKRTLYRYIKKNPEFGHHKEILKQKPNLKAKMNWIDKINENDYSASKEWLQAKSKDEFSTKTNTGNTDSEGNDIDVSKININIIKPNGTEHTDDTSVGKEL